VGFRFWRRIKVAPGVTLNLSKSGGSVSLGPRGAKHTIGPRGQRTTVGIPGTGLFYTTTHSRKRSGGKGSAPYSTPTAPAVRPEDLLTLSFFQRLTTPDDEKALVNGCRELVLGNEEKSLMHLEEAVHLADGAFLAGFLSLKQGRLSEAATYLTTAADKHSDLGRFFSKYGISATMSLPVTVEVSVHVGPDLRGVLLGLVEVYQRQARWAVAIACLEKLKRLEPDDVVVKLSLAELLLDSLPDDKINGWDSRFERADGRPEGSEPGPESVNAYRKIVELAEGIENESPIHTALLLYKAKALRSLGLLDAARETLTAALHRKKDRSGELLKSLRYERALVYEDLGQSKQARSELEILFAEDQDYKDVAERLGL